MGARRAVVVAAAVPLALAAGFSALGSARAAVPNVLLVGSFHGIAGQYASIQDAVDHAAPGDFVLVGPGDYREKGHAGNLSQIAGVLITTPDITLRGMDRNSVVVDGTLAGAPAGAGFGCDAAPSSQDFGPKASGGTLGRNGIEVWKTDGVSVENLTVCNFLGGSGGGNGNELWFNGGDGSGHIGEGPLYAAYITASSSYNYATDPANHGSSNVPMGQYGIFTSNEKGPGQILHTYSSNMGDSDYYIGACADCNVLVDDAHAQNSSLGFSGTNAGGRLTLENSEWDHNRAGIAPNALNNDDWPSPPDGACPAAGDVPPGFEEPIGNGSCSVIFHNRVHDNNNQNAPAYGIAGAAPPGTGILLSGVRNYSVFANEISGNNSWGLVINDFPDTETPPASSVAAGAACRGGTDLSTPLTPLCDYPAFGNDVRRNHFSGNGANGNPGNGDIAVAAAPHNPGNCFSDNTDSTGNLTSDPPLVETLMSNCGLPSGYVGPSLVGLLCAAQGAVTVGGFAPSCPQTPITNYPTTTAISLMPIPHDQATMPNPCEGVPANAWCNSAAPTAVPGSGGADGLVAASSGLSLPDTAGIGNATAFATLAAGGLLAIVALPRRRRRRS